VKPALEKEKKRGGKGGKKERQNRAPRIATGSHQASLPRQRRSQKKKGEEEEAVTLNPLCAIPAFRLPLLPKGVSFFDRGGKRKRKNTCGHVTFRRRLAVEYYRGLARNDRANERVEPAGQSGGEGGGGKDEGARWTNVRPLVVHLVTVRY